MTKIQMNVYGKVLTDRSDGVKTRNELLANNALPIALDFIGVISLGSSFGDEVVAEIAFLQGNKISLMNCNAQIKNCIALVQEDSGIEIEYVAE